MACCLAPTKEFIQRDRFPARNFGIPLLKQCHPRATFGNIVLDLPVPFLCIEVLKAVQKHGGYSSASSTQPGSVAGLLLRNTILRVFGNGRLVPIIRKV